MTYYYWSAFFVTLCLCFKFPTKLSPLDSFIGSIYVALFGFVVWPLVAVGAFKLHKAARAMEVAHGIKGDA